MNLSKGFLYNISWRALYTTSPLPPMIREERSITFANWCLVSLINKFLNLFWASFNLWKSILVLIYLWIVFAFCLFFNIIALFNHSLRLERKICLFLISYFLWILIKFSFLCSKFSNFCLDLKFLNKFCNFIAASFCCILGIIFRHFCKVLRINSWLIFSWVFIECFKTLFIKFCFAFSLIFNKHCFLIYVLSSFAPLDINFLLSKYFLNLTFINFWMILAFWLFLIFCTFRLNLLKVIFLI